MLATQCKKYLCLRKKQTFDAYHSLSTKKAQNDDVETAIDAALLSEQRLLCNPVSPLRYTHVSSFTDRTIFNFFKLSAAAPLAIASL